MARKVLILAANPTGTSPTRLEEEVREIDEGLRRSKHHNQFELFQRWAVRPRDIQQAMLDVEPQIVHFCGYGVEDQGLIFEDAIGQAKLVSGEALAALCNLFSEKLECVVLNGCYSEIQAEEIAKHVLYVIGMEQAISDTAAIEFAVGFYGALGADRSVEFAYKSGCTAIQLVGVPEHLTPVLHQGRKSLLATSNITENSDSESSEAHYESLIKAITAGRVVPFLGSDINLCDRSIQGDGEFEPWRPKCPYPPSGKELAAYLAKTFPPQPEKVIRLLANQDSDINADELPTEYPLINEVIHEHAILIYPDSEGKGRLHVGGGLLQYLSQYAYLTKEGELYDRLQCLELGCQPNQLHRFFASLPAVMRDKGYYPPYPLIVTTNYDRALEQAFEDANEPFDLVFYSNTIDAQERDKFVHQPPDGPPQEIQEPNKYKGLSFDERPVILKLYGTADQISEGESLVITEEHYIEYLVSRDLSSLLPAKILGKLRTKRTNVLFLGYLLGNWNQRIILHRIWQNLGLKKRDAWWAVQASPRPLAQKLWQSYNIVVHDWPLKDYIAELDRRVKNIPAKRRQDL
ncbi:hypothetical protein Lepto7375DRAFT_0185 [Leptolyngbya sp. PCC 7375]|nr:hypothetical protein Lepto7375DRAFT_0185 [Leptolyngbya sp. PCC 7375]